MPVRRKKKTPIVIQNGEGFMDFLKGANKFLKDTKIISGLAGIASSIPALSGIAAPVAGISSSLGYGMKKKKPVKKKAPKKRGGALGNSGGALRLAGQSRSVYR